MLAFILVLALPAHPSTWTDELAARCRATRPELPVALQLCDEAPKTETRNGHVILACRKMELIIHPKGFVRRLAERRDGVADGLTYFVGDDGESLSIVTYRRGKQEGPYQRWSPRGTLLEEVRADLGNDLAGHFSNVMTDNL